jgi:hypothetical protein
VTRRARVIEENPLPPIAWIAIAVGGALVVGTGVYLATRSPTLPAAPQPAPGAQSLPLPAPPPTPAQAAAAGATAASSAAIAAASAAAALAGQQFTYEMVLSGDANISIKVGDTVHIIPSMNGSPSVDRMWVYSPVSVVQNVGTISGADMVIKAVGAGVGAMLVQNVSVALTGGSSSPGQISIPAGPTVFASYTLTINVS